MAKAQTVSDAELDVLKLLWEYGPATVRGIRDRLRADRRRWAYNTVLTLLYRLRDKGYVTSKKDGVANVFSACVSRDAMLSSQLDDLAQRVCDGTASPIVHALVQAQRFSQKEINELRDMLDRLAEPTKKVKKDNVQAEEAPQVKVRGPSDDLVAGSAC